MMRRGGRQGRAQLCGVSSPPETLQPVGRRFSGLMVGRHSAAPASVFFFQKFFLQTSFLIFDLFSSIFFSKIFYKLSKKNSCKVFSVDFLSLKCVDSHF